MRDDVSHETAVTEKFLKAPNEDSFTELFNICSPQLVAFFRARNCKFTSAEDLSQEVMLNVYRKAQQIRHRELFRAWLFKIARNTLCRHYDKPLLSGYKSNRINWLESSGESSWESGGWSACKMGVFSKSVTLRICRIW